MSIATEIKRLQEAKDALKISINNKGIEVTDADSISVYASKVDLIVTGGSDVTLTSITITDVGEYRAPEKTAYNEILVPSETFYKKYVDEKGNTFIVNENGEKIITVSGTTPTPTDEYVYITIYIPDDHEYSAISSTYLLKTEVSEAYFDDVEYDTRKTQDGECFVLDHRSITKNSYHTVKLKLEDPDSLASTQSNFSLHFGGTTMSGFVNARKIILPEGLTTLNKYFVYGYDLEECVFPTTIKFIGKQAFEDQKILEINLPNSLFSIGNYAFSQCSRLTSVTIPESVKSIGSSAFSNCTSLTSITYNGRYIDFVNLVSGRYHWRDGVPDSCVVHCTDGDYPITDFPN